MQSNTLARPLALIGLVNQRLLLQCKYPAAENRVLRSHLPSRVRLSDPDRRTLAEIGGRLGRRLAKVTARDDSLLVRRLIARRFDGSRHRAYPGRPRVSPEAGASS